MANPNDRLITTIGMMDATASEHDGEAVNAFRAATKMLKAQGLTWREIAQRALDKPGVRPMTTSETAKAQGFGSAFDGAFADIFGDFGPGFRRPGGFGSPPPEAAPAPKSRRGLRIHGVDVPAMITGAVRVIDADRKARNGEMLVLEIVGDEGEIYGPLVCFSGPVLTSLRRAIAGPKGVIARIQPPRTDTHMPVVVSVSVGN